ncbi:hypothetical protein OG471_07310 [Streptomyces sp. NBC_01336]|uniref:hypothetical protein n=1 Tax=Streptomyces sp. NBC_01336 TaxID=2903829 RepID=UPI002E1373A1|nr:hypothetical protein OG471_07310 [Streptomyces sp. NBC_01336]
MLFLTADRVRVDVDEAEESARVAPASGDADAIGAAPASLGRELLPDDRYADWARERRRRVEMLCEQLVRRLAERVPAVRATVPPDPGDAGAGDATRGRPRRSSEQP